MKKKKIHICFACDNNYLPYAAVAFYSVLQHRAAADHFCVWLIADGIGPDKRQWFLSLFPREEIRFVDLPNGFMKNAPVCNKHLSTAAYARLAIGSVLPLQVTKVIYLDCDLLVHASLAPLFAWNLQDKVAAGVEDWGISLCRKENTFYFPGTETYINSGVLLINLKKWRHENVQQELMNYATQPRYPIRYEDQDVLNFALNGRLGVLPGKWNVMYFRSQRELKAREAPAAWLHTMEHPKVIHFGSPDKPWFQTCQLPYAKVFQQYMQQLGIPFVTYSLKKKICLLVRYAWTHPVFWLKPSFWKKWARQGWRMMT